MIFGSEKFDVTYLENKNLVHLIIIILISIWVLSPVHLLRFLWGWDDQWAIFNRFTEAGFTWSNIYSIFTTYYCGQYAPINQLYYTIIYYFFAYNPIYYHIGGLVIHVINACLVYYMLINISNLISNNKLKNSHISLLASVLFAISPFNLEPVAWVSATKVTLYALFYFSAIICYCKYLRRGSPICYYLTIFLYLLSFGAKEQAVTLPLCLILIDYLNKRDLTSWQVIMEKIPFLILSLLFGIISIESQGRELFGISDFYPFYQRIILSFFTLSEYFTKSLLPINISYLYPFPFQIGEAVPILLWYYPAAFVFILYAYWKILRNSVYLNFGILFFIIHLIFVINILSLSRFSIVADRYAYVATVGIYFIIAYIVFKYIRHYKTVVITLTSIYCLYFGLYTNQHIYVWTNAVTLKKELREKIRNRIDFEKWKVEHIQK